jgi:hypothetical protein
VPDRMMVVPTLPTPDYLHAMQASGLVRASMNVLRGPNQGIAFATAESSDPCAPGTLCYDLLHLVEGPISWVPPKANMTFALMNVSKGSRRAWADAVRSFAATVPGNGHYLAAAHAFGPEPYNAVVEAIADDANVMHEMLLGVTDVPGVEHVDLHVVAPEGTRGMGNRPT